MGRAAFECAGGLSCARIVDAIERSVAEVDKGRIMETTQEETLNDDA